MCAASSPTSDSMCNIARTSESGNKIHSEEKLSFRECESEELRNLLGFSSEFPYARKLLPKIALALTRLDCMTNIFSL